LRECLGHVRPANKHRHDARVPAGEPAKVLDIAAGHGLFGVVLHNRAVEKSLSRIRKSPEKNTAKMTV
jgi:hypothetical protein